MMKQKTHQCATSVHMMIHQCATDGCVHLFLSASTIFFYSHRKMCIFKMLYTFFTSIILCEFRKMKTGNIQRRNLKNFLFWKDSQMRLSEPGDYWLFSLLYASGYGFIALEKLFFRETFAFAY